MLQCTATACIWLLPGLISLCRNEREKLLPTACSRTPVASGDIRSSESNDSKLGPCTAERPAAEQQMRSGARAGAETIAARLPEVVMAVVLQRDSLCCSMEQERATGV